MKNLLSLALIAIALIFTQPGCGTPKNATHEAIVFNSFKTTYNTTRSAYEGYLVLVVQRKVSEEDEVKIDKAWNDYRAAFKLAFIAASQNWEAATPYQVQQLSSEFIKLVSRL